MRIFLLILLSGCGFAPVKTYDYSWGRIHKANQAIINEACGEIATWDDGTYIKPGEHPVGCRIKKDIWVVNSCLGAESIPHELAHMDGVDDPDEEGYSWESE